MDLYIKLFDVLFPVFFVIGVGYYLGIRHRKGLPLRGQKTKKTSAKIF